MPSPPADHASLFLERHSALVDRLRGCRVLANGRELGEIKSGDAETFELATGPQELELDLGGTASNAVPFCAAAGETFVLQCGAVDGMPADVAAILRGLGRPFLVWPAFDLSLAWFSRGLVLGAKIGGDQARAALEAFERGLLLRDDAAGHFHAARAAERLDASEVDVVARLDRALELWPDYVDALLARGAALASDRDAALRSIDRALELAPQRADAHLARAEALHALGREEESIEETERTLALDGTLFAAHEVRRLAFLALGRPDPTDVEFGARVLAEYRRLNDGYGMLPYRVIQDLKTLDRQGFAQLVGKRLSASRLATISPEEVAARLAHAMHRPEPVPYAYAGTAGLLGLAVVGLDRAARF